MPIEVQHSAYSPSLDAALSFLLAQTQPQQQQPQQPQPQDILSRLAPLLAGHSQQQPQPSDQGGYINPASFSASNPGPQYVRHGASGNPAADHSVQLLNQALTSTRANNELNNQDALAQFRAQQQNQHDAQEAALEQQRQQQQNDSISMQQGDVTARWAQDVPAHVQQGIADGSYKYSPAQQKQMQEALDAVNRVDTDPSFSPPEKERLKQQAWLQYKSIHSSPQPVPLDQRPVTPQQQAAQNTWMEPDPVTGQNVEWQLETRNGSTKKVPTETGKAVIQDWLDDRKSQRQLAHIAAQAALKPDPVVAMAQKQNIEQHKAALGALMQRKPTPNQFNVTETDDTGAKTHHVDYEAFSNALSQWQDQYDKAVAEHYGPANQDYSQPLPPPQNPLGMDDGGQQVQAASGQQPSQRPLVSSRDELRQQLQSGGLNIGDTVNTPLGPRPITQDVYSQLMGAGDAD